MNFTLLIHFPEKADFKITFNLEQEMSQLLDYDTVCKKILHNYKFITSQRHSINLFLLNFHGNQPSIPIPVFIPKNWTYLVADMIKRDLQFLELNVKATAELKSKKVRPIKQKVQFDSDGSVESVEDSTVKEILKKNRPSNKPYRKSDIVKCQFCRESNRDQSRSELGPFYGPFKENSYAHLLCLLWCSPVYLDEEGTLKQVNQSISKSKDMRCDYCMLRGASFTCHQRKCIKEAHYRCASHNDWYFDWINFQAFCPNHLPIQIENTQNTVSLQQKVEDNHQIQMGVKLQERIEQ